MVLSSSPRGSLAAFELTPLASMRPTTVITVARQFGSGGDELAHAVADALGVPLLDREILARAANQAGVSEDTIAKCERRQPLVEQILERLALPAGGSFLESPYLLPDGLNFVTNSDYRRLIERVITQIADGQEAVILGHASQVVLKDRPRVLKVLVHARMEDRIARVMETEEASASQARRLIAEHDRDWEEMFRSSYRVNWMDARLYDLVINRSQVTEETALRLALSAAAGRPIADCGCL
ncbi:MAG: cytidylate kinase-like family protein [Chloroflexi bacterium]|nr:cytidylate kinase-like family protein [Chloroflexota bacterium]